MIQTKVFDSNAEWRYYGNDDNKSSNPTRCGMPVNQFMPKSSIGSVIGMENTSNKFYQYTRMKNITYGIQCLIKNVVCLIFSII